MKKTIIHIGYPKTGTTWFNTQLYTVLKDVAFVGPPVYTDNRLDTEKLKNISVNESRIIVSDPELAGTIRFQWQGWEKVRNTAKQLRQIFPESTVVIFIRNQFTLISSLYLYYVRKGGTYELPVFINNILEKRSGLSADALLYYENINLWKEVFGEENVKVFLYEVFIAGKEDFIKKYVKELDLTLDAVGVDFSRKNAAVNNRLFGILKFTNRLTRYEVKRKKYYLHIPGVYSLLNMKFEYWNKTFISGKRYAYNDFLDDEIKDRLKDQYAASNNRLKELPGLSEIGRYGYPLR